MRVVFNITMREKASLSSRNNELLFAKRRFSHRDTTSTRLTGCARLENIIHGE